MRYGASADKAVRFIIHPAAMSYINLFMNFTIETVWVLYTLRYIIQFIHIPIVLN